jgi:ornithine carbamoyltransferase
MPRHLLSQNDLSKSEIEHILDQAALLKPVRYSPQLLGKSLVMFFEKTSTRTRLSFEIGMTQLGGHAVYLDRNSSQLARGESIRDMVAVVSRYADILMARVYADSTIQEMARYATIPVINGLSDLEHPTQSMADLMTMRERKGRLQDLVVAYLGDGNNNVTHSLLLGCSRIGAHIRVAAPPALQPLPQIVDLARANAAESGSEVLITDDPQRAVAGADVIYTDTWISMGREEEQEQRVAALRPYQVNAELVRTAQPDYIFMHCLPQHVGDEVTAEVTYGPHSVIFDQAENRLHVQKAILLFLLSQEV